MQKLLLTATFTAILTGCNIPNSNVLVQDDRDQVTSEHLSITEQINLYESALQHYHLKLALSQQKAEQKWPIGKSLDVLLVPPSPPIADINVRPLWWEGNVDAPLKIQLLCSYQSTLCAHFMIAINNLLPYLGKSYLFEYSNTPLRYHRFSNLAASSENCLSSKVKRKQYRQFLWLQKGNLSPTKIKMGLMQQGMTAEQAQSCVLNAPKEASFLNYQDHIHNHHLTQQASLWINNRYVSLKYWERQFFSEVRSFLRINAQKLDLPEKFTLSANWLDRFSRASWSKLHTTHNKHPMFAQLNGFFDNFWVYQIDSLQTFLFKNGYLYKVTTAQSPDSHLEGQSHSNVTFESGQKKPSSLSNDSTAQVKDFNSNDSEHVSEDERYRLRYEKALKDTPIYPINGQWLEDQLIHQIQLEEYLSPTSHELSGMPLLKLNQQSIDEFYQTLGMEPDDVVVRINDEWIHSNHNPMWEIMQNEAQFTISVVRKGLPVHFAFKKSDF